MTKVMNTRTLMDLQLGPLYCGLPYSGTESMNANGAPITIDEQPFVVIVQPVQEGLGQVDGPDALGALGSTDGVASPGGVFPGPGNPDGALLPIDITGTEGSGLTPTGTGDGQELHQRLPVLGDRVMQDAELLLGQEGHFPAFTAG